MDKIFNPKSIAIIGASSKKDSIGGIILRNLLDLGYQGKLYPINPKYKKIGKLICHPSLKEANARVDLAVVVVPAKIVPQVIEEATQLKKPVSNFVIISAGFKEAGAVGEKLEDEIASLSKKYNLDIVGPNCLGVINPWNKVSASFARNNFEKGKIGLIMQSGALTTALFDLSESENLGFSKVVSIGNKAVLDETDFLEYLRKDKQTKVIGLYIEDIKRGREFMEALRRTCNSKPVVVIKAGNSQKAKRAVESHTGAMAGEEEVVREAIESSGGVYIANFLNFIENLKIFSSFKKPKSCKTVVLTNAGGAGVLTTDLIEKDRHLNLREFDLPEKRKLLKVIPEAGSTHNPLDILGDAAPDRYNKVLKTLRDIRDIGAVLCIATAQAQTDIAKVAKVVVEANKYCSFPVIPVMIGAHAHKQAQNIFKPHGLNNFIFPVQAVSALSDLYTSGKRELHLAKADLKFKKTAENVAKIADKAAMEHREIFYFSESMRLAEYYKINVPTTYYVGEDNIKHRFPLVVKIDSPQIIHKDLQGGVVLDIFNDAQLERVQKEFQAKFPDEEIIIQNQVERGLELILGIKRDANFGPVVMLGIGGTMTEIFSEKIFWLLPCNKKQIEEKLEQSKLAEILQKKKIEPDNVAAEVLKIAKIAEENKWIREFDINPMVFYKDKEPIAVDIKVFLS
ncbi:MAG: acetate--CoA ligase family protein [Candidatus Kuenenbacteria bacterium]